MDMSGEMAAGLKGIYLNVYIVVFLFQYIIFINTFARNWFVFLFSNSIILCYMRLAAVGQGNKCILGKKFDTILFIDFWSFFS